MSLIMSMGQMIDSQEKGIELKSDEIKRVADNLGRYREHLEEMERELDISKTSFEYAKKYLQGE